MSRHPIPITSLGFGLGLLVVLAGGRPPTAHGQPKPLTVPPAPQAPTLTTPAVLGMKRGGAVELVLPGTNLADPLGVCLGCPGKATVVSAAKPDPAQLKVKFELPPDVPVGLYPLRVATAAGVSNLRPFLVDDLDGVAETEASKSKDTPQDIPLGCSVGGRTDPEASDYFRVKVPAGRRLTFEVVARRAGSPLDPIVVLHDAKSKRELIDLYADDTPGLQGDCRLVHTFKDDADIIVEVRDTTYRGGPDFFYRLRVGEFPGATTAFPLMVQRGRDTSVGFAGPGADDIPPVAVAAPTDPAVLAVNVVPKRSTGTSGWPVAVRLTDEAQSVEVEPNNEPGKANRVPVPGGVSARFGAKNDLDHFVVAGKKGQKLAVLVQTYELNAPTEVLVKVLDGKGVEAAKSDPQKVPARVEFTPPADGDYTIACEHLNYLHGPHEVYHLGVKPVGPDVDVSLALDRYEAPAGGGTAVAVATVNRLNGYAGSVELNVVGSDALSGRVVVPAGQTQAFVPVWVKEWARPGAYPFQVKATITAGGQLVERFGTISEVVKVGFGGLPNPPPELLTGCVLGVVEKPPFGVALAADPVAVEKGKSGKIVATVTRAAGSDGDVGFAPLFAPANVTAAAPKPAGKGQGTGDIAVTAAPNAAAGPGQVVIRATGKAGGKDYAVTPPPVTIEIIEPKKEPPKKDEPKKP
ncbi:MAG: hypothetical protein K2X87_25600 [Gemmataceae bacterium]|nr:hypothetical protein [Gemmataceae bacterium]